MPLVLMSILSLLLFSPTNQESSASWRPAKEAELREIIPARAPVEKERIETEFRTASAITDGKGRFVAGVVLITAGYSAEGKYSHFLLTQAPIRIAETTLNPGEYVMGFRKSEESLTVRVFDARNGTLLVTANAPRTSRIGRIESFHIYPPNPKPMIQIGRFAFPFELEP
jgi:hypothetical protein